MRKQTASQKVRVKLRDHVLETVLYKLSIRFKPRWSMVIGVVAVFSATSIFQ